MAYIRVQDLYVKPPDTTICPQQWTWSESGVVLLKSSAPYIGQESESAEASLHHRHMPWLQFWSKYGLGTPPAKQVHFYYYSMYNDDAAIKSRRVPLVEL
jgi:hypothetical protein